VAPGTRHSRTRPSTRKGPLAARCYHDSVAKGPYRQAEAIEGTADEQRARSVLARDLTQDEEFIWAGRPKQGIHLSPSDFVLIPTSLVWAGFAVFWEGSVISAHGPFHFRLLLCLLGVPFVLMGAYITVGRFFVDERSRARTFYGVTNRRALIATEGWTRKLTSVDLLNCTEVSLEERANGVGTIFLGRRSPTAFFENASWPMKQTSEPPAFRRIAGVRNVFNGIRDAQEARRARPS
jgi:hypothetical protein